MKTARGKDRCHRCHRCHSHIWSTQEYPIRKIQISNCWALANKTSLEPGAAPFNPVPQWMRGPPGVCGFQLQGQGTGKSTWMVWRWQADCFAMPGMEVLLFSYIFLLLLKFKLCCSGSDNAVCKAEKDTTEGAGELYPCMSNLAFVLIYQAKSFPVWRVHSPLTLKDEALSLSCSATGEI